MGLTYETVTGLLGATTLALLDAHALHALLQRTLLWRTTDIELAQRNAAVLVVGSHLLPFLNLGDTRLLDGV